MRLRPLAGPLIVIGIAFAVVATVRPSPGATPPGVVCATAKQKATFKLMYVLGKCKAKATKDQVPVDLACMSKALAKFGEAFEKAEAKGGCATVDDALARATHADACVNAVVAALPSVAPAYTCGGTAPNCGGTCPPGMNCEGGGGGPGASCDCYF